MTLTDYSIAKIKKLSRKKRLPVCLEEEAVFWWLAGRDTLTITHKLIADSFLKTGVRPNITEAMTYNSLSDIREAKRPAKAIDRLWDKAPA